MGYGLLDVGNSSRLVKNITRIVILLAEPLAAVVKLSALRQNSWVN